MMRAVLAFTRDAQGTLEEFAATACMGSGPRRVQGF